MLLAAIAKVETNNILAESYINNYISAVLYINPARFAYLGAKHNRLSSLERNHKTKEFIVGSFDHNSRRENLSQLPREIKSPKIYYRLIVLGNQPIVNSTTRDKLAHEHGILYFGVELIGSISAS